VPSITASIDSEPKQFSNLQFEWHYSAKEVVRSEGQTHEVQYWGVGLPDDVPKPTAEFTRYLIFRLFLCRPCGYNAGTDYITLENFNDNAIGILVFKPLRSEYDLDRPYDTDKSFKEIWSYRVGVDPNNVKNFWLTELLVAQNGHILYPIPYTPGPGMWGVRRCERTPEGLLIEILTDFPSENYFREMKEDEELAVVSTQYLYRPDAGWLEYKTSETIRMHHIEVEYYLKLPGH
jgi:hypothetical protein